MDNVIQIRIDNDTKMRSASVFEKLGIDLSTAIRIFLKKSIQLDGFPFSINKTNDYDFISAIDNILALQKEAEANGCAEMSLDEINAEISDYRKGI